jgi:hypothetical protein
MLKQLPHLIVLTSFLLLAGCGAGTHSRGQFHGHVVGATEEQIVSKMGKPADIDAKDPKSPRWVYKNKTSDPDNFNKVDERTIIILERNAEGKLVGKDVLFG